LSASGLSGILRTSKKQNPIDIWPRPCPFYHERPLARKSQQMPVGLEPEEMTQALQW